MPVAVDFHISRRRRKPSAGYGFPDTEGLDAQLLVDKLIEYGVLTDGTEVPQL